MIKAFLNAVAEWAGEESDILAIAVVGSYARGEARTDSDVDIVFVVTDPERYFSSVDWMKRFGETRLFRDEDWGRLRSRRVHYVSGLEVEFGFTVAAWASTDSVDRGTQKVVADGLLCVYDPKSMLRHLAAAVQFERD